MILPSSLATLAAFLLLLAPGLVWARMEERRRPPTQETAFSEIATTILASLTAVVAAAVLLGWVWVPLADDLRSALAGQGGDLLLLGGGVTATSAAACGLAVLANIWKHRNADPSAAQVDPVTVWFTALGQPPGGTHTYGEFLLSNGDLWRGRVARHDVGARDENPKILLVPPLAYCAAGSGDFVAAADHWQRVVIQARDIVTARVAYPTS